MGKPRDLANVVATGNILADGAVAPAELTGVTSTAAELNILDGVTATAAELNIMDGVTATTAELNYVDGVTSNVQTQMDTKAPVASPTFTGTATAPTVNASTALQIGGTAITATAAELNKMDGVTVSASDINSVTTKAPIDGATFTGTTTIPTADINGGAIDGAVIGANSAAAVTATTVNASTKLQVNGTDVITNARQLSNIASVDATTAAAITTAGVGGGGSAEFTAGEAITAGDAVSLNSSGQLVKVSGAVQSQALPDSSSTLEVRSGGSFETASGADLLLIPNTSKVIWIYNYNSDVKAQILSVNGTTISKVGSEISVSSRNGKHIYAAWGPSSGDKFAIVYRDSAGGDDGFVALCSYNSATDAVTIESETNISTEFSTNRSEGTCVVFDESASAFLFAFKDGLVSNRGYVGVATLSGTTWTFGSKVTFNTNNVGDEISLVYDASLNLSMLVYIDSGVLYAHRVTVSGTTPTVSTEVTNNDITWNEDVASSRRLAGDGEGRFIVCYDSSSNTRYILIKATSSSTTIVDQTELKWYDATTPKADFVSVAFVPFATPSSGSITGRWVSLGYNQSTTRSSFGFAEEAGANNVTRGGLKEVENSSGNHLHGNLGLVYVPAQGTIVGVGAAEGSTSFAFGAKLAANSSTATEFVGLAEAGIASGASGDVTVTGGINTAQSGLTAGTFYYLTAGGGLSTSSTSFPLGIAKSSTNLLIGGNAADYNVTDVGAYQHIAKVDAANSSTVDCSSVFTDSDGFSSYYIILDNLTTASSTDYLWMRFTVGGSVVGSSQYGWSMVRHEGTGSLASNVEQFDTKWRISNQTSNTGFTGNIEMGNTAAGLRTQVKFGVAHGSSSSRGNFAFGGGSTSNTSLVDGFHLISSAPNFTSGTVRIYGVKNV